MRAVVAIFAALVCCVCSAADVPREAYRYKRDLIREARAAHGPNAPIAVFAAQIHQESGWNPNAMSRAGARGLSQFMPTTERWVKDIFPELAEGGGAMSPVWSIRALVRYDVWLLERIPEDKVESLFDAVWAMLRSYNGGLSHWLAEAKNAGSAKRAAIDASCGTARRATAHCKENLNYPKRILVDLQPLYLDWGPGVES